MDKLKFALFSIVVLGLLGLLGYWSIRTLQTGTENATEQKVKQLEKENEDLKAQLDQKDNEIGMLKSQIGEPTPAVSAPAKTPPVPVVYKYQSLMDDLQKLVNDNVVLKLKSSGTRVGTVQKFLNIYNNTSNKIDNDYGAGTAKAVTAFEKSAGLIANGEADAKTFNAMIDWLKKQG